MRNLLTGLMATALAATFVTATANSAPLYAPQSQPAGIMQKVDHRSHWRHGRHWDNGRHLGWKKRHWRRHMTITATATAARSVVIITGTTGGTMTGTTTTV